MGKVACCIAYLHSRVPVRLGLVARAKARVGLGLKWLG